MLNNRFEKLLERYSLKTNDVPAMIDGRANKRCDIKSVNWHKRWVMTIPSKIYYYRSGNNRALTKEPQMNFQMCKKMLIGKRFGIGRYFISTKDIC